MDEMAPAELRERGLPLWMCKLLTGADVGVFAGLFVLGWFCFQSWLAGDYWFARFNLAAAPFFGERIFYAGAGKVTVAGASLLLVIYVLVGCAFGMVGRSPGFLRNVFLGLLIGAAWQVLSDRYLWSTLHPFAPARFTKAGTIPANLMFGLLLARYTWRFRVVAETFGGGWWKESQKSRTDAPAESAAEPEEGTGQE
jgi:hypothetical protein